MLNLTINEKEIVEYPVDIEMSNSVLRLCSQHSILKQKCYEKAENVDDVNIYRH